MEDQKKQQLIRLGQVIRQLRKDRGWSQDELAERCGYNTDTKRSMISAIENGKTDLTTSKIKAFADAFGMTGCQLISLVEDPTESPVQQICDLFERCYGKESYRIVQKFLKLDDHDKGAIEERLEILLESSKYKPEIEKASKGDSNISQKVI